MKGDGNCSANCALFISRGAPAAITRIVRVAAKARHPSAQVFRCWRSPVIARGADTVAISAHSRPTVAPLSARVSKRKSGETWGPKTGWHFRRFKNRRNTTAAHWLARDAIRRRVRKTHWAIHSVQTLGRVNDEPVYRFFSVCAQIPETDFAFRRKTRKTNSKRRKFRR